MVDFLLLSWFCHATFSRFRLGFIMLKTVSRCHTFDTYCFVCVCCFVVGTDIILIYVVGLVVCCFHAVAVVVLAGCCCLAGAVFLRLVIVCAFFWFAVCVFADDIFTVVVALLLFAVCVSQFVICSCCFLPFLPLFLASRADKRATDRLNLERGGSRTRLEQQGWPLDFDRNGLLLNAARRYQELHRPIRSPNISVGAA